MLTKSSSSIKIPILNALTVFLVAAGIPARADQPAGTWTPTGPMPSVRLGHAAIRLPNGQVLVAGGADFPSHDGAMSSSAALYDPISNTWSPTASMGDRRGGFTLTLLANGKVLAAGGANWGGTLATAELYDYTTGLWTPTASMPNVRHDGRAILLPSGKVLVVGGVNIIPGCCYLGWLNAADIYDPVSGTWSATASMATPRQHSFATLLGDGKVLVAGGFNPSSILNVAEVYDPASGTWSPASSMALHHHDGTVTLLPDGSAMVVGGFADPWPTPVASAEVYNPISGTWTFMGSMGVSRSGHTATLMAGGRVLVAGGYAPVAGLISPTAEIYDSVLGTWSPTASMSTGRNASTATLLADGRVLVAGGVADESGIFPASAEVYSEAPTTPTTTSLINLIGTFNLAQGIQSSLITKLQNAQSAIAGASGGDMTSACGNLSALINEVRAQAGKKITTGEASQLISVANQIKAAVGCR